MAVFYGEVFKALNKAKVKYVVAGGVAVVLHGYMRATGDLDLIVFLDQENLLQCTVDTESEIRTRGIQIPKLAG